MGRRPASESMTVSQKMNFHTNFRHMWDVLGTTYYYVVGTYRKENAEEKTNGVSDPMHYLPAYNICSKCYSADENYYPTRSVVQRIVCFYNQWIRPEICVSDFLDRDLRTSGALRIHSDELYDSRFEGVYSCFYYSDISARITGACLVLRPDKEHTGSRIMKAVMISGFRTHQDMKDKDLAKIISDTAVPDYKTYCGYFEKLPMKKRNLCYWEGTAEISQYAMAVALKGADSDFKRLSIMLNVRSFPNTYKLSRPYEGGLAYVLSSGNPSSDPRFYRMGIARSDGTDILFDDDELASYLQMKDRTADISLSVRDDSRWIEYIRQNK